MRLRFLFRWWLLVLLGLAIPGRLLAHGGGAPQIVNEPAGPYLVSAWTDPDPLRTGTMHITVALAEPNVDGTAGEAILNAAVRVVLEPQAIPEAKPVGGLATHENAVNRLFYEADLELPAEGIWRANLLIDGPVGPGNVAFEVQVLPPATVNWPILIGAVVAVIAAAVMVQLAGRGRRKGNAVPRQQPEPSARESR